MPWPAEIHGAPARHLRALLNCNAISEELPLVVDGSRRPSPAMTDHLRTCLRCQAELAGYRRLLRVLRSLRDEPVAFASPELVSGVLRAVQERIGSLGDHAERAPGRGHRWAAGTVAALGAAALGVGALWVGAKLARVVRGSRASAQRAL